ncbi:MAG: hypothetical protein ACK5LR_11275, partial [Mangrovibacterium sp.]
MKRFFPLVLAVALMATACNEDDNNNGGEKAANELSGDVTGTVTLDASVEYDLKGALIVTNGATLNIPAGTTIRAQKGFGKYILVEQGGTLNVNGTAAAPVVMTADDEDAATAGYWGGLIINGKAPISGATSGSTATTEVNNAYIYGGSDATDNSGSITYLVLKYTGAKSSSSIEHNGLTLNAVGNGTKIENIFVVDGADDGIEFFGGSVNVSNLLVVNSDDDMFDFTQGYTGTLTNCYGVWENGFTSGESDPRGVEADGNFDGLGSDHLDQSNFTIANMTIQNLSSFEMQDAIKVRRGATAAITNALVKGGLATDLVDLKDSKGNATDNTSVSVTYTNTITNEINQAGSASVEV